MNERALRIPRWSKLVLTLSLASACGAGSPPPRPLYPEVQWGPGRAASPGRVLALSASCGSVEFRCPREYVDTVDAIVRGGMEFAGFALVQPDQLRNRTRQRHETHETTRESQDSTSTQVEERPLAFDRRVTVMSHGESESEKSRIVLDGPGFEDLTVSERRDVVREAGADAVLAVRIVVGAQHGAWSPDQRVEVMVQLGVDSGATMAWAARCSASSSELGTVSAALEHAARCAIEAGTGRSTGAPGAGSARQ